MKPVIDVCVRSSKRGIGFQRPRIPEPEFAAYALQLVKAINRIRDHALVRTVYVLVNGDPQSTYSESVFPDQQTPTSNLVLNGFRGLNVIPIVAKAWGQNPGSGVPMMEVASLSQRSKASHLLVMSKEIELTHEVLDHAMIQMAVYHMDVIGFYREYWWRSLQWQVPQNTCCLWKLDILSEFGFDARCDGDGSTVEVDGEYLPIAGMEDFHLLLRVMKKRGVAFRWGMVESRYPLHWDTSHKNSEELRDHRIKLARQVHVMRSYCEELFPGMSWENTMEQFFRCRSATL